MASIFLLLHIKPVCETMLKTIIKNGYMKIVTVAIFGKIFDFHPVMLHQSPLLLSVQTYYQTIPLILSKVINLHFWLGATQNKFQEIEFSFCYPLQPSRPDNKDNHKIFSVSGVF